MFSALFLMFIVFLSSLFLLLLLFEILQEFSNKDSDIGLDKPKIQRKIVNIFLSIIFSICFGCSKEPSH